MQAREHRLSIWLATKLASAGVTANMISMAGLTAGCVAGVAFASTHDEHYGWLLFLLAAIGIQMRLLANMLDGIVAVQMKQASPVGELFNEVPDRLSDTAILVGAGYALGGRPELGFLAAIAAILTAYMRAEGKVAGAHQEYCGPLAKPQRMAVMTVAALVAGLIPQAWQPSFTQFPGSSSIAIGLVIVAIGGAVTFVRRLMRIAAVLQKGKR